MEFQTFLTLMKQKRTTILGVMALFLVVAAILIAVQPFKYSSTSQLLVVQEYSGVVDAYTASKSSEHLSSVLASVVGSNSFFTKVTTTSPSINTAYFGVTAKDQIKEWHRTVKAQNINDSGIIAITVYHPNRSEAEKIAGAVNYVMMTQHSAYDGAGEAVKVRLIDQPVTSSFPVKPNIIIIVGTALLLGFIFSLMYIYVASAPSTSLVSRSELLEQYQKQTPVSEPGFNKHQPRPEQRSYTNHAQYSSKNNHSEAFNHQANPKMTPYGHRTQIQEDVSPSNYPHSSYQEQESDNPEEILHQGHMRNILG